MLTTLLLASLLGTADASDHAEAPAAAQAIGADLSDLYAWHEGDKLWVILTFGWHIPDGPYLPFDPDALFGIHFDHDGDGVADHDTWIRFGTNAQGFVGVKVEGLPGGNAEVIGGIEEDLDGGNGLRVKAMLADDPFFMDLEGFKTTLQTGDLSIDATRDSLAGTRVDAIVLEMDLAAASGGQQNFQLWATSARK